MNIGCIGLGKMGEALVYRACMAGHTVWAYDEDEKKTKAVMQYNAKPCNSIEQLMAECSTIWLMVLAGKIVDDVLHQPYPYLKAGMTIIDSGNSNYKDTIRRAEELESINVNFVDCGTSGGMNGREKGFSLMIGGKEEVYKNLIGLFHAFAAPNGFCYIGPSGSGHYVKMVHNGVEYALLQSYAEGMHLLHDGYFKDLNLTEIAHVWQNGSVIRSWIGELLHEVLAENPDFEQIPGGIGENLTGAWTQEEGKERNVKTPMLDEVLAIRSESRKTGGDLSTKLVALLRKRFGGHQLLDK